MNARRDDEEEDELPEWEALPEEKIPPGLSQNWQKRELKGRRAGVCRACGTLFSEDDLTCVNCGAPAEIPDGVLVALKRWLFESPFGILVLVMILVSIIGFLVQN